jgi:hypothetical protein
MQHDRCLDLAAVLLSPVRALNQYATPPDLTIILSGNPELSRQRAFQRGIYSRFHAGDAEAEHALYQQVGRELEQADWNILQRTVGEESAAESSRTCCRGFLPIYRSAESDC